MHKKAWIVAKSRIKGWIRCALAWLVLAPQRVKRERIDFCAELHARVCVDADGFMQHDLVIIKKLELEGAGSQLEIHAKSESSLT